MNDLFELPVETRLRLRMMDSKRRLGHRILRAGALVALLAFVVGAVGLQQVPGYVAQMLAPLTSLHS